ncbi:MAG TPA: glycosyltransferase family 2 protein [Candidatus Tectomicrobia bacterium]|nr:glycosyltransferase family 2 protein [Candidatus Tectomicrobia bacterium]
MDLSVVVPVYNEADNILALHAEIVAVLRQMGGSAEIIVVDDGSTDATPAILRQLAGEDPTVTVIRLSRNFGQTAALAAGLAHAQGDVVVTLDGDLQNDPADIPRLVAKLEEGYDLVNGWRVNRQDPFIRRRLPSMLANRLISRVTRVTLHDYGCTLKAFRGSLARSLRLYGEMHRFIPALAGDLGAAVAELPVHHRPRLRGRSKYGLSRTLRVVLDLLTVKFLTAYLTRPIHVFGLPALLLMLVGVGLTVALGVERIFLGVGLADRPILLLAILLTVVGVQFLALGLLGETLGRLYHESQDKPVYVVREILGVSRPPAVIWDRPPRDAARVAR